MYISLLHISALFCTRSARDLHEIRIPTVIGFTKTTKANKTDPVGLFVVDCFLRSCLFKDIDFYYSFLIWCSFPLGVLSVLLTTYGVKYFSIVFRYGWNYFSVYPQQQQRESRLLFQGLHKVHYRPLSPC